MVRERMEPEFSPGDQLRIGLRPIDQPAPRLFPSRRGPPGWPACGPAAGLPSAAALTSRSGLVPRARQPDSRGRRPERRSEKR